jgi:hypothetical protein
MFILVLILCFLFSCSSELKNNSTQNIVTHISLDTMINTTKLVVLGNDNNDESYIHVVNTSDSDTVDFVIDGLLTKSILEDVNNDSVLDALLKFSDQSSCMFMILSNKKGQYTSKECNYEINDLEVISWRGANCYASYSPLDCHGDYWKSDVFEFTNDSFRIIYSYREDYCDAEKYTELLIFKYHNDFRVDTISQLRLDSMNAKNLPLLWNRIAQYIQ